MSSIPTPAAKPGTRRVVQRAEDDFFCPCPRGLEALLVDELTTLGAAAVQPLPGGVAFRGDWRLAYAVNLESRIATRVLCKLGSRPYRREDDVYALAHDIAWERWFSVRRTIRVYTTAVRSPLKSIDFITLKVKDAVCDRFRARGGQRPSVASGTPDVRIHVFLTDREATLYVDTSGEPLYKRGFKVAAVEAPLKENLAAGIILLSGWDRREPFFDPMCGSGTLLIEAAQMALDVAPGLGREFAFEKLENFRAPVWDALKAQARERARKPEPLPIYGSDHSGREIARSRENLRAAGVASVVTLEGADVLQRAAPAAHGVMVSNPPYGVRLEDSERLQAFYPRLGDTLKQRYSGWRCYFISADAEFPKLIKLKASKRTPLYNGALECRLFEYRMVAGKLEAGRAASATEE